MSSMQDYASCETLDSVSTLQGDSDTPELRQRPISMVSSTGMVFQETDAAMAETENLIKNSYEAAVQALGTTGAIIVGINVGDKTEKMLDRLCRQHLLFFILAFCVINR